jgi:oligopeptide/dipeptide ABC transporter ATP-binding protein
MSSGDVLLDMTDVTITYHSRSGPVRAVRNVDLQLADGECIGVVGESGSGKSTLGLAIPALLPDVAAVGGSIKVAGVEVVGAGGRELSGLRGSTVGLVYQDSLSALNPVRTIGSQLREVFRRPGRRVSRGEADRMSVEVLGKVSISDPERRMRQYPHEFSGGMRQRVAIAMAIAARPRLLIADEPTTALDVTVQAQILDLIMSLSAELGMAVLLVSHDLDMISEVTDSVAVMYHGSVVETGSTADVLNRPRHPYTAALLDSVPSLDAPRISFIPGQPLQAGTELEGCVFEGRCRVGHGREECRTRKPVLRRSNTASAAHLAACHYPLTEGLPQAPPAVSGFRT